MSVEDRKKPVVLYVDDETDNLVSFRANFRREFTVFTAENAADGLQLFKENEITVLLTDQKMPGMSGVDFLRLAAVEKPDIPRIIVTAYSDISLVIAGVNEVNIFKFIQKPWNIDYLRQSILQAHELVSLRRENLTLIEELKRVNEQLEFYLRQKLLS
jgi:DNA-binding NtrC family response regulator